MRVTIHMGEKVCTKMTLAGTVMAIEIAMVMAMTITGEGVMQPLAAATETSPLRLSTIMDNTAGIAMEDSPSHRVTLPATSSKRVSSKYVDIPMTYSDPHSAEEFKLMTVTVVGVTIAGNILLTNMDCIGELLPVN